MDLNLPCAWIVTSKMRVNTILEKQIKYFAFVNEKSVNISKGLDSNKEIIIQVFNLFYSP